MRKRCVCQQGLEPPASLIAVSQYLSLQPAPAAPPPALAWSNSVFSNPSHRRWTGTLTFDLVSGDKYKKPELAETKCANYSE